MIYLVVGVDRSTLAGWHANIQAEDAHAATSSAIDRARERGVDLVVAAVIGPGSNVVAVPARQPRVAPQAA
jgi:uncharacterized protein GlcG (DUF336 family)